MPADRKNGFSLLELLVVLSIVAGVMTVILACFEGGFRVYARIRDQGSAEADVYLMGEHLARDLSRLIPGGKGRLGARELLFYRKPLIPGEGLCVRYRAPLEGGLLYLSGERAGIEHGMGGLNLVATDMDVTFTFASMAEPGMWLSNWDAGTNMPHAVRVQVRGPRIGGEGAIVRTILLIGGDVTGQEAR